MKNIAVISRTSFEKSECENDTNNVTNMPEYNSNDIRDVSSAATESAEEDGPVVRSKRRVHRFSDSDQDSDHEGEHTQQKNEIFPIIAESTSPIKPNPESAEDGLAQSTDDDEDSNMNIVTHKSRLRKVSLSSDSSDSDDAKSMDQSKCYSNCSEIQDSRISNKRNKLKEKFRSLATKRLKESKSGSDSDSNSPADEVKSDASQNFEDEPSSINKIKQKIKEKTAQITSSICDPDTSDEERSMARGMSKPKKERRSTKPTSPKPMRMSAKQAIENMQKIKSESNRMLREKEVSLPYHRPKALSLKDILSKRRPAVSADGKALPIRMNEEQLRQYAQQLEQRQKEVIELCKSESEDEPDEPKESEDTLKETQKTSEEINLYNQEIANLNDTIYDDMSKTDRPLDNSIIEPDTTEKSVDAEKMDKDEPSSCTELQRDENKPHEGDNKPMSIEPNILNDSDRNNSAEMELVYNDSVKETGVADIETAENTIEKVENIDLVDEIPKLNTEVDSQLISLQYDNTETTEYSENVVQVDNIPKEAQNQETLVSENSDDTINEKRNENDDFSDDDINMNDIDALIENAEIVESQKIKNCVNSPMLFKEPDLASKPKLTGAPGMVIDLDGTDPLLPRKLTGVELLKERFVFFAKLKTREELERDKEKTLKPGALHLKLKQELEEQMAEQRSLEWAKRLEEEKQHKEHGSLKEAGSDAEDIDYIETKLIEKEEKEDSTSEESEEEIIEHDMVDKPRKRNPMVDDEAEESDCDEISGGQEDGCDNNEDEGNEADGEQNEDDDEDETAESSDESEEEQENKPKKGRILKAFEDSDDEDSKMVSDPTADTTDKTDSPSRSPEKLKRIELKDTQDVVIQLAQKSQSEDLFTSQDSKTTKSSKGDIANTQEDGCYEDKDLGTQTFSILKENVDLNLSIPDKLPMTCDVEAFASNLDAVVGMCSGSFSQNLVPPSQITDVPESQVIGENVLALCTGQFYDNQFVSQDVGENCEELHVDKAETLTFDIKVCPKSACNDNTEAMSPNNNEEPNLNKKLNSNKEHDSIGKKAEDTNLKSILDELNDPEFDVPKPNKYFVSNMEGKENKSNVANAQLKKKFVIESDDDEETEGAASSMRIKKKKKKKMEQRALQISDDEEEDEEFEEDYESDSEMVEEDEQRIVEYDSDENEVIVQPQILKKKRKLGEFFENEAELTSEDEWVGSGDEDEAGLDRMEREEGDDDNFNQNQLQRELGQIHMRDVLDQDKREVRLIQELLFEDGDLGAGSRQRKFRWKDVDGEDDTGAGDDEFADTQEDEAESEEQWRKQRHEREMFLRSLNNPDETSETLNISVNRTSMIKANLSKNSSDLFVEVNTSIEMAESPAPEKKTAKDIPSPKKPFAIFQQNYHGSLLTRGRGALARLAALATPLAADDDAPKVGSLAPTNKRNFVFAAVDSTKHEDEPKVNKRKAQGSVGTPRLVKKLRTEDKHPKTSLLDHLKS